LADPAFGRPGGYFGDHNIDPGHKKDDAFFYCRFIPSSRDTELVDILYQKKHLSRGPRIVAVGGGTGLSVLLSGLKSYSSNISAIVTVADDGGSSGRLRQQFDVLPPGDIRNCLVALADAPALMRDLSSSVLTRTPNFPVILSGIFFLR